MGQPTTNVLSAKDVNTSMANVNNNANAGADSTVATKPTIKSMEYHRQMLQSKMEEEKMKQQYISPSDDIMSPCTAKLNALKSRQVNKAKPKSLFAQASAKKFNDDNVFGANKSIPKTATPPAPQGDLADN